MPTEIVIAIATLAVTLGGVVFHAGRLTARVESLEQWRHDLNRVIEAGRPV